MKIYRPNKIISGGETGAQVGALVGAKRAGIATSGCASRGYLTESGEYEKILRGFGLFSHPSTCPKLRSEQNITYSDATLIVVASMTATKMLVMDAEVAVNFCKRIGKDYLLVDLDSDTWGEDLLDFIVRVKPQTLNVCGNEESVSPGIASKTAKMIQDAFSL